MDSNKLESFLKLDYRVMLDRKDGRFVLHVPALHLFVEDSDLSAAYARLEQEKRTLFERYLSVGREQDIPVPAGGTANADLRIRLTPFLVKSAVVALVGVLLISAANVSILYTLQEAPGEIAERLGRNAMKGLARGLELAASSLTPEREERVRAAIREATPKLKPIMDELSSLMPCSSKNDS